MPHLTIGWANLQWPPTHDPHHQRDQPHRQRLRPGVDRWRDQPARRDPQPARPARLWPGRQQSGRQPGLDLGGRSLQRRRRQQRRVRGQPAARDGRHLRLRLPLHHHQRPRLAVCRPERPDRGRRHARPTRQADRELQRRHHRRRPPRPTCTSSRPRRPAIDLAWDAVTGDPTLYGYEVLRSDTSGGPYTHDRPRDRPPATSDTAVVEGATYYYVVRAVDHLVQPLGQFQRGEPPRPSCAR